MTVKAPDSHPSLDPMYKPDIPHYMQTNEAKSITIGELAEAIKGHEVRITSETGGQKCVKDARFDLIPADFLWKLAEVYGMGAKKYSDDNYRKGYDWRYSYGAMLRHLNQFWMGEETDTESGLPHLVHAAWHCATLYIFSRDREKFGQFDTRPEVK